MDEPHLPRKPLPPMTPEEIATLLAEYGASGPYDDLLDIPDVSKCVFDHGGRDVFLTGTSADEFEEQKEDTREGKFSVMTVDSTWPLESVLMRFTDIISSSSARPLLEEVERLVRDERLSARGIRDKGDIKTLESVVCSTSDGNGDGISGDEPDTFGITRLCSRSADDRELLKELDRLLEEGDKVLASRRQHFDPMSEDFLAAKQAAVEEEKRLWCSVDSDVDDGQFGDGSGDDSDLSSFTMLGFTENDDGKGERSGEVDDVGCSLKTLYAFEYGPTMEEQNTMDEWDNMVETYEKRASDPLPPNTACDNPTSTAVEEDGVCREVEEDVCKLKDEDFRSEFLTHGTPEWYEKHAVIMQSISSIEARDRELQNAAARQLETYRHKCEAARRRPCPVPGMLTFERFTKRVDTLLPPGEAEVRMRSVSVLECVQAEENEERDELIPDKNKKSRVDFDSFRQVCEMREATLMEAEDLKAIQEWREALEKVSSLASALENCIEEQHEKRDKIIAEEERCLQLLREDRQSDADRIVQRAAARKYEAMCLLFSQLEKEHMCARADIVTAEERARKEIHQKAVSYVENLRSMRQKAVVEVLSCIEKLRETVTSSATSQPKVDNNALPGCVFHDTVKASWWYCSPSRGKKEHSRGVTCAGSGPIGCVDASLRLRMLLQERAFGRNWLKDYRQQINDISELLRGVLRADEESAAPCGATSASRPTTAGSSSSLTGTCNTDGTSTSALCDAGTSALAMDSGARLDAGLAKRIQPHALDTAGSGAREVAQLCHSLSFALEQICDIDFSSLASLALSCSDGSSVFVAPFVQELDLGGNKLQQLHLDDVLRIFPSIRVLNVSDNKLCVLKCRTAPMRGVSEAQAHSVALSTKLSRVDLSVNAISNIEAVGKLLSYHLRTLVIFSNKIESLLPLMQCTRLECLQASRNAVTSLMELKQLSLLHTVDLSDNCIEVMDPIAEQLLLQNLYLSRNRIKRLPPILMWAFLRQLFLNGNGLRALPDDCFRWLPLLTVIHVENNELTDISGLSHCLRLQRVDLSFNQLQSVGDLLPLTACRMIQSLSVTENPFAKEEQRSESTDPTFGTVTQRLLGWFPYVSELNNEKVSLKDRVAVEAREAVYCRHFYALCRLREAVALGVVHRGWCWPCGTSSQDAWLSCGYANRFYSRLGPIDSYAQLLAALVSDVVLTSILYEQDVLAAVRRRRYFDALHVEEGMKKRFDDCRRNLNPITQRLSDKVEELNHLDSKMMTEKHIHKMQSVSNFRGNVHVINVSYVQRARAYKEASAKKFICRWLHDCCQIRRAKRELESLRFAFKNSEKQRNEAAARIIQPVGRGAIARWRMRRILNSVLDDDDDANFTKVSVDFLDDAAINLESVGVSSVLQRVLQNRSLLPNFSVLASSREVASSSPLRTGSAVQLRAGSIGTDDEARNRPVSQPEVESTSAFNDGDEWGALVSSQLEKRQKQMERARREKMRREFMNDPIRVKRELQKR